MMSYAIDCQAQFLSEKLSETYVWYGEVVSQLKIVYGIKKLYKSVTLLRFMKGGA